MEKISSIPEPAPINVGVPIPDALRAFIAASKMVDDDHKKQLIQLVTERDNFGRKKYGQPLMSHDGRNGVEDARQELGDLLQYVFKCRLAKQDTTELEDTLLAAFDLFNEMFC